jgi:hypothetical protein
MGRLRGESCRGPKGSTLRTPQCLRVGRKEESVRHQGKLEEVKARQLSWEKKSVEVANNQTRGEQTVSRKTWGLIMRAQCL